MASAPALVEMPGTAPSGCWARPVLRGEVEYSESANKLAVARQAYWEGREEQETSDYLTHPSRFLAAEEAAQKMMRFL